MMMSALMIVFASLFTTPAVANESAYARVCRQSGGYQWVLNLKTNNEYIMCNYNTAMIGAPTLFDFRINGIIPRAVEVFMHTTRENNVGICQLSGGQFKVGVDTDKTRYLLCVYPDGSYIEKNTLERGRYAVENMDLSDALGLGR